MGVSVVVGDGVRVGAAVCGSVTSALSVGECVVVAVAEGERVRTGELDGVSVVLMVGEEERVRRGVVVGVPVPVRVRGKVPVPVVVPVCDSVAVEAGEYPKNIYTQPPHTHSHTHTHMHIHRHGHKHANTDLKTAEGKHLVLRPCFTKEMKTQSHSRVWEWEAPA